MRRRESDSFRTLVSAGRIFHFHPRHLAVQSRPVHEVGAIGQTRDGIIIHLLIQDCQPGGFLDNPVVQASYHVIRRACDAAQFRYARFGNGEKAPFRDRLGLTRPLPPMAS